MSITNTLLPPQPGSQPRAPSPADGDNSMALLVPVVIVLAVAAALVLAFLVYKSKLDKRCVSHTLLDPRPSYWTLLLDPRP
eukprot:1342031-Rhodomonas_salina.1